MNSVFSFKGHQLNLYEFPCQRRYVDSFGRLGNFLVAKAWKNSTNSSKYGLSEKLEGDIGFPRA